MIEIGRELNIPFDQVWKRLTRSQVEIVGEVMQMARQDKRYETAALTNAAVSAAIAMSFGKDQGRFARYLERFRPQTQTGIPTPSDMKEVVSDDLKGWSDF